MRISCKIPSYSIEQGNFFINGKELPRDYRERIAPYVYDVVFNQASPVRLIRDKLFSPLKKSGHYFVVEKTYSQPENQWLNDKREGFATYQQALAMVKEWRKGAMDGAEFKIKVSLIG